MYFVSRSSFVGDLVVFWGCVDTHVVFCRESVKFTFSVLNLLCLRERRCSAFIIINRIG